MSDLLSSLGNLPVSAWVGLAVSILAMGAFLRVNGGLMRRRLNRLLETHEAGIAKASSLDRLKRVAGTLVSALQLKGATTDPALRWKLRVAGYEAKSAAEVFVVIRFFLPIGIFALAWLYAGLFLGARAQLSTQLLIAAIAGLLGVLLPTLYLKNRMDKRRKAIQRAWPNALDLLVLGVEAGLPIDSALSRVAQEIRKAAPILSEELVLTVAEMQVLPSWRQAFENLAARADIVMVRRVVSALVQAEEYGGSIAPILRSQARATRALRISEAERRAAALPPLLTVPMIVFFMPSLFAIVLTPSLIAIFGGK